MKQNLQTNSLAETIFGHADREEYGDLEVLLNVTPLKIAGDEQGNLEFALHFLCLQERPDLAKKVISKIDLETFTKEQNFELLLGVGNNRFAEVFSHMIDYGFDAGVISKGRDVFSELTGQSVRKGYPEYGADYSMVKKLLESGKVQGFVKEQDIASALIQLETKGPRSLNRKIVNNGLPGIQQEPRGLKRTSSEAASEQEPSATTIVRPGSQPASISQTKENKRWCVVS